MSDRPHVAQRSTQCAVLPHGATASRNDSTLYVHEVAPGRHRNLICVVPPPARNCHPGRAAPRSPRPDLGQHRLRAMPLRECPVTALRVVLVIAHPDGPATRGSPSSWIHREVNSTSPVSDVPTHVPVSESLRLHCHGKIEFRRVDRLQSGQRALTEDDRHLRNELVHAHSPSRRWSDCACAIGTKARSSKLETEKPDHHTVGRPNAVQVNPSKSVHIRRHRQCDPPAPS
jgi:hypothetical protein